jgi:hypothetical protein
MVAAVAYLLSAVVVVILFGCCYVIWIVLSDLAKGWSEACHRGRFPRQFGIGFLFAMTTVVAITCFLFQGERIEGLGQGIVMFVISLAWAAAIVYGLQCMLSEYRRQPPPKRPDEFSEVGPTTVSEGGVSTLPPGDDDSAVELEHWLAAQEPSGEEAEGGRARPASTNAVRSHFRVQPCDGPKGVKFGRV